MSAGAPVDEERSSNLPRPSGPATAPKHAESHTPQRRIVERRVGRRRLDVDGRSISDGLELCRAIVDWLDVREDDSVGARHANDDVTAVARYFVDRFRVVRFVRRSDEVQPAEHVRRHRSAHEFERITHARRARHR
jgi:hypothetical protein